MRWRVVLAVIAVLIVSLIAGTVSFTHIDSLALTHGYTAFTAALLPLSVDGLIVAASISLMAGIRPGLSRFGIGLGVTATLAANVTYGVGYGVVGAIVGAWPAVAFIVASEILVGLLRSRDTTAPGVVPDVVQDVTPEEVIVSPANVAPELPAAPFVPAPVEMAPSVPELPVEPVQDTTTTTLQADTVTTPEAPVKRQEKATPKTTSATTGTRKKAARHVAKNPDITSADLATKLGVSQRTAQRHLVALREA